MKVVINPPKDGDAAKVDQVTEDDLASVAALIRRDLRD